MKYIEFYNKYKNHHFINKADFMDVWSRNLKGLFRKAELPEIADWWNKMVCNFEN